jgi:hypothetical protein
MSMKPRVGHPGQWEYQPDERREEKILRDHGLVGTIHMNTPEDIDSALARLAKAQEALDREFPERVEESAHYSGSIEFHDPQNPHRSFKLLAKGMRIIIHSPPTFGELMRLADWFGLALRKRLKAMLGDYDSEVRRLRGEGRPHAARWNAWLAHGCFWWYVLRGPADWLVEYLAGSVRGRN